MRLFLDPRCYWWLQSNTMDDFHRTPRVPHQPVTEEIIRQADKALTLTKGNRPHAAEILGWESKRMYNVIASSPHLQAKWSRKDEQPVPPGPLADLQRDKTLMPFAATEEELAAAMAAEDELWKKGYEKLNFTPEKKDFLGAVMNAHGNHWKAVTQMFQGGVSYTATELLFMFHKLEKEIQDTFDHPEKYEREAFTQSGTAYIVKSAHEFRLEMMDRALSIAEMFRKLNLDTERAQLLAAQVQKLRFEDAKKAAPRKKAAWTAMSPKPAPTTNVDGEAQQ